jgi:voltage-gated potassium channel
LITSVYIAFILLLLSSYLIFICENSNNPSFRTYSDALYWSIITMATIGYGDITPKTFYGNYLSF